MSNENLRVPAHPGEILLTEFLVPLKMSQQQLADAIFVPFQRVNEIVNEKRGITPSTALRFSRFFGNSAEFWMNLQMEYDLYRAEMKEEGILFSIQCIR